MQHLWKQDFMQLVCQSLANPTAGENTKTGEEEFVDKNMK